MLDTAKAESDGVALADRSYDQAQEAGELSLGGASSHGRDLQLTHQEKKIMKKEIGIEDDLRPEYDLKQLLRGGVKGKYAERYKEGTNIVLLAPDVADAFPGEEAVNEALQLVMQLSKIPVPDRHLER